MRDLGDLVSAAAFFTTIIAEVEHSKHEGLKKAAEMIEEEAKHELGTYQGASGPFAAWAPLKPETIARKANGDAPLLETGDMRDSIEHKVAGHEAHIGSDSNIAVYQELGTSRIPPRSFLGMAASHKSRDVVDVVGRYAIAAIEGKKAI